MEGTPNKPMGPNTSEGVLANFFNSLLRKHIKIMEQNKEANIPWRIQGLHF